MTVVDDATLIALLQQERWSELEQVAHRRVEIEPGSVLALFALATARRECGRLDAAVEAYARLAALEPWDPAHLQNLAAVERQLGRRGDAETHYAAALALLPGDPQLLLDAGLLALDDARVFDARERFDAAVRAAPGWAVPLVFLARCQAELCEDDQVRSCLDRLPLEQLPADLGVEVGTLAAQIGDTELARRQWERARRDPASHDRATALLAGLHERLNQVDSARALLASLPVPSAVGDAVIRQEILQATAAVAARDRRVDAAVESYAALLASSPGEATRARIGFDLGRLLVDQHGRESEALATLGAAHACQVSMLKRAMPAFVEAPPEPLTMALADLPEGWMPLLQGAPAADASPVFVVGFPRSGTTLLEQMLDAHPALASMDERTFIQDAIDDMQRDHGLIYPDGLAGLDTRDLDRLRARYFERVATQVALTPGVRLVDKNPLNILRLPMMAALFPNARYILALRHPCDVLLSCYMQNFRSPVFQYLCRDLPSIATAYANAMQGWMHTTDMLSPACLTVRYEDLLDDLEGTATKLARFLDLPDAHPMLRYQHHAQAKGYISTPSYAQVVQPLNRKAAYRWKRFAAAFEEAMPTLQPWLQRWGYES
ncbi:tetratricopeptide repeat-containing sulfotransferase family protein [Dyella sp. KRB-257]|uniref:tetratricopeptide repeat-containing sulfotransferase family protein n=1 Tax=Dyella sp. KRB-257 TaxID=3400915 RepID=UPI003BFE87B6